MDRGLGIGDSNEEELEEDLNKEVEIKDKNLILTSMNCASLLGDFEKTIEGYGELVDKEIIITSQKDLYLMISALTRITNKDFARHCKNLIIMNIREKLGIPKSDVEKIIKEYSHEFPPPEPSKEKDIWENKSITEREFQRQESLIEEAICNQSLESLRNDNKSQTKLVEALLQNKYEIAKEFAQIFLEGLIENDYIDEELFQKLIGTLRDSQQKEFHKDIVDILVRSESPKKLNLLLEMVQNQEISSPQLSLKILARFIDYYSEKPKKLKNILNERNLNLETLILDNLETLFSSEDEIYIFFRDYNYYQINKFLEFLKNSENEKAQEKISKVYKIFEDFFKNKELSEKIWNAKDAKGHFENHHKIKGAVELLLNHSPELFIDILSEIPADSFLFEDQLYSSRWERYNHELIEKCLELKNNSAIKVLEKILIHEFDKFKKSYEAKKQGADVYVQKPLDDSFFPSELKQIKEILKFLIESKDDETKKAIAEESINNIVQAIESSPDFRGKKEILGFIIIEGNKELKKFAQNLSELLNIEIDYSEYEWYLEKYEKKEDSIELAKVLNKYIQENRELFESKFKESNFFIFFDIWEFFSKDCGLNPEQYIKYINEHFEDISAICQGKSLFLNDLDKLIELSQNPNPLNFIQKLSGYGYRFNAYDLHQLPEIIEKYSKKIDDADVKEILTYLHQQHNYGLDLRDLDKIISLFQDKENLNFIQKLSGYGYRFNSYHLEFLSDLRKKESEIITKLDYIKKYFPEFRYEPILKITDPYEILYCQFLSNPTKLIQYFYEIQKSENALPRELTDKLIDYLRIQNPLLKYIPEEERAVRSEETYKNFNSVIIKFSQALFEENGTLANYRGIFINQGILHFLACKPERVDEVINLPTKAEFLFNELLSENGPLYSNIDTIIRDIFSNGDIVNRAKQIESIFRKKVPYWKNLFSFTDIRIGEFLATAQSEYPVSAIPKIKIPLGTKLADKEQIEKGEIPTKFDFSSDFSFVSRPISGMSVKEKRAIANLDNLTDDEVSQLESIEFTKLKGIYKKMVFGFLLSETIRLSRDPESRKNADKRNREFAKERLELKPGMYLHGSNIGMINSVLLSGNLPREALGEGASTDAYPFHVDFTRLLPDYLQEKPFREAIEGSLSAGYGDILYLYRRDESSQWQVGIEYSAEGDGSKNYHALMLAGMPSTEISAIILKSPENTLEIAKKTVVENGFYIPIYDIEGNLLFAPEDFDAIYKDLNLKVEVDSVWDYSLETGGQAGSNPGAFLVVPGKQGTEKYYVKFEYPESPYQIWMEKLAEDIYRLLDVPVPKTKVVALMRGGSKVYGHASLIISGRPGDSQEIKSLPSWRAGFLADCLLANWDIPYAPERNVIIGEDGQVYRIDNGGVLIYRARGQLKTELEGNLFSSTVNELKLGTNHERLGLGMRQEYPGLTEEELREQAKKIRERLTDEKIDELVDSIRSPQKDRDYLKRILKERRNFILANVERIIEEVKEENKK